MDKKPKKKTGLARIWAALFYSLDGLRFTALHEAAFMQEVMIVAVALIVMCFLPLPLMWKALLLFALLIILIVELLNSAIEAIVDMASPEYHPLAKRAKDAGSAAVLVSIVTAVLLWFGAILTLL